MHLGQVEYQGVGVTLGGLGAAAGPGQRDSEFVGGVAGRLIESGDHAQPGERVTPTHFGDDTQELRFVVGTLPGLRPQHNGQISTGDPGNIERGEYGGKFRTRRNVLQSHTDKN